VSDFMLKVNIKDKPISRLEINSLRSNAESRITSNIEVLELRTKFINKLTVTSIIILIPTCYFICDWSLLKIVGIFLIGLMIGIGGSMIAFRGTYSTDEEAVKVCISCMVLGGYLLTCSVLSSEFYMFDNAMVLWGPFILLMVYGSSFRKNLIKTLSNRQILKQLEYAEREECLDIEKMLHNAVISEFRNKVVKESRKFLVMEVDEMKIFYKTASHDEEIELACRNVYLTGLLD
jgi:hypothetical protein